MNVGMRYNQRDIVLIPFPYSDLTNAKQRPALIISNKKMNQTADRICCLITSKYCDDGIKINELHYESGSLTFQSWVKPFRIFTIDSDIIIRKLCTVTKEFHQNIISALSAYLKEE